MSTQTAYLLKYEYSKCVFNQKCILNTRTLEEGKSQAKSIKILKSQAKFTLLLSGNPVTTKSDRKKMYFQKPRRKSEKPVKTFQKTFGHPVLWKRMINC